MKFRVELWGCCKRRVVRKFPQIAAGLFEAALGVGTLSVVFAVLANAFRSTLHQGDLEAAFFSSIAYYLMNTAAVLFALHCVFASTDIAADWERHRTMPRQFQIAIFHLIRLSVWTVVVYSLFYIANVFGSIVS